jgi:hypothetical protein
VTLCAAAGAATGAGLICAVNSWYCMEFNC